ncbi:hypothetical protein HYFRA_00014162 [Hymenoscyphus fraxineus]|uniref:BTB domain-containing protein n=1 Tax=Hymenoscyphus fraxineus TaxID=746836 RepID=A0A9N9L8G6_9HELO|nr:hypothetical protein HYFRA_00014162 [Hymenoscyphus fraxineus]
MAESPRDTDDPAPIVLARRNLHPDVHLQVFDQQFHAHSMALKMNSEFFRSFFDSADKNQPASDPEFKYMWVTKVDDDGSWSLVWEHAKKDPLEPSTTTVADIPLQINAFKTVLFAIHSKGIIIESAAHLAVCTQLADYYRCLPILSQAVSSSLMDSTAFVESIAKECRNLLETAARLRNKLLFKECLIHLTGPWIKPQYLSLQEPLLKAAGEKAYESILILIAKYHEETLRLTHHSYGRNVKVENLQFEVSEYCTMDEINPSLLITGRPKIEKRLRLPEYYRKLYARIGNGLPLSYESILKPLLKSNLRLDRSGELSGKGKYAQFFLCADIRDEDLPWNIQQEEW